VRPNAAVRIFVNLEMPEKIYTKKGEWAAHEPSTGNTCFPKLLDWRASLPARPGDHMCA
jgi:hypothetical protein